MVLSRLGRLGDWRWRGLGVGLPFCLEFPLQLERLQALGLEFLPSLLRNGARKLVRVAPRGHPRTDALCAGDVGFAIRACFRSYQSDPDVIKGVVVASQAGAHGMGTDGTRIYWALSSGSVMSAALDGSDVVAVATGENSPIDVAVDGARIYWANGGSGVIRAVAR